MANRRKCHNCGRYLPAGATARRKFCNDRCRVAYHRRGGVQELYNEIMPLLSKFQDVPESEYKRAIETLRLLRSALDDQLRMLGDMDRIARWQLTQDRQQARAFYRTPESQ